MKPAPAPSTLVVAGEDTAFATMTSRVDPEGARRMMDLLVNLYADQRLAVVREYVSNAVDATRVAGSTEPVLVTTPTLLEPNFIVTDRGVGMSMTDVEAAFLAFAASTKRDTNELVGGLGVGAKSAWALAESFLVDTVRDGRRTLVRASRDLSHQVLLAGEPTDLPTGTTISVPVEVGSESDAWRRVINEVATAHDPGAVMVDGKLVTSIAAGPARIGPVLCRRVRGDYSDTVMIRSGGTLFASVPEITSRVRNATSLSACVLELPIGSFDHTPSRESIVATDRTKAAVKVALEQFTAAFAALEQRITDLARTDVAAAVKLRADTLGGLAPYTVLPIPFDLRVPGDIGAWSVGGSSRGKWVRTGDHMDKDTLAAVNFDEEIAKRTVIVTGVPAGRTLRGFATFLKENRPTVRRVIPLPEGNDSVELVITDKRDTPVGQTLTLTAEMVPDTHRYTWQDWAVATAPRRGERGATAGYQCVLVRQDGEAPVSVEMTAAEIAALNIPVWYVEGDRGAQSKLNTKASVGVYLGKRKTGPLLATVPTAMTLPEWKAVRYRSLTAGWTRLEKLAAVAVARFGSDAKLHFEIAAAAGELLDGDHRRDGDLLGRAATLHEAIGKVTTAQHDLVDSVRECEAVATLYREVSRLNSDLLDTYPLLRHLRSYEASRERAHFIEYIAAITPRRVCDLSVA